MSKIYVKKGSGVSKAMLEKLHKDLLIHNLIMLGVFIAGCIVLVIKGLAL